MRDRLRGYIDSRGELKRIANPIDFEPNLTRKYVRLGGATVWFKSADAPDSLYGEDVRGAVADEITRWKEESWFALYTTLGATQGRAKLIGNVKGRRNFAYRLARRAQAGEPGWGYHRLTADDAIEGGVLNIDVVDQARRDLPEQVFRELFYAEPGDDEGSPFGRGFIEKCVAPLSSNLPVCWGWDLAKSVDWTVGIALDEDGHVCRFERFQAPWEITVERIAKAVGNTPALIDSTGVGDPPVEALQRRCGNVRGFKFSQQSKQQVLLGLAVAIQSMAVRFPDGVVRAELDAFEYEYTATGVRYSAPAGMHDDCVCALALAVERMRKGVRPVIVAPISIERASPWVM